MTDDRHGTRRFMRLRTLVEGALETPEADRLTWVERMCADDLVLQSEVLELIRGIEAEERRPRRRGTDA